ncbi:MAG: universal stress protein, partial [Candidatus Odinarchaeota archaeon]
MSERKMDDIETMFKKTARPKTVIDEYPKINRIGVVLDSSKKGENALRVAVDLAIRLKTSLHVIVSEDYYQQFDTLIESSKKGLNDLQALAEKHAGDAGIKTDIEQVIGKKLRAIINAFDQETQSGDTLGGRLIERIKESGAQIMVIGVPMFKSREDHSPHESLGTYVFMLLRERTIPANFLLVSEQTEVVADSVLAFVSVEQQPASIVALYRRALSFATEKTDFKLIGMVNDKVIETVARLDMPVDDPSATLDLDTAKQKLVRRLEETLESISL